MAAEEVCSVPGSVARAPREYPDRALEGRRVLLLIVGHLSRAPRAIKEAAVARAAGARVLVRGNWHDDALAAEDRRIAQCLDIDFAPAVDLRRGHGRLGDRIRQRGSQMLFARTGLMGSRVLGPGAPELLHQAVRIAADLTMVHSEQGLWVGEQLLQRGRRVGVDFEDWFSQDLLPADRPARVRRELRRLEHLHLRQAHCRVTTTSVLSRALALDAGVAEAPDVVPNCAVPPLVTMPTGSAHPTDPVPAGTVSLYWVSQTIGPGRGLETLAAALPRLRGPWQLCLRGALHGYRAWFESVFPAAVRDRIHVLAPVQNDELASRTRCHHVGLALEVPYCANKDLTASNKLFEYLAAGLAVVATRTAGQSEVLVACPEAGWTVEPGDPAALAATLQTLLDDPLRLARARKAAGDAGRGTWHWDRHAPVLAAALARGIGSP